MKNNKNYGFTLAEVLITLGIIGVVAALTLPNFVSNSRFQAMASKLSSTMSSIENAFSSMMASENADDLTETKFFTRLQAANYRAAAGELGAFLDTSTIMQTGDNNIYTTIGYSSNTPFEDLSGNGVRLGLADYPGFATVLKNGALMVFEVGDKDDVYVEQDESVVRANGGSITRMIGSIDIDVNASEKPNKYGRDVFRFGLGDNGHLYPVGGRNVAIVIEGNNFESYVWNSAQPNELIRCNDSGKTLGCTARLVEKNFKIDF